MSFVRRFCCVLRYAIVFSALFTTLFTSLFPAVSQANQYYRFKQLNVRDGLSQNTVNEIVQDSYGFIWIGTQDGLNRFDGFRFEQFKTSNKVGSLSGNWIETLFIDQQQRLWVGTLSGGLNLFDHKTQQFKHFRHDSKNPYSLSHNRVSAISQLNDTTFLIGTHGGGVNLFNMTNEQFSRFGNIANSRRFRFIHHITQDKNNDIWLATAGQGVVKLDRSGSLIKQYASQKTNSAKGLVNNNVHHLFFDSKEMLWAATDAGLHRFNAQSDWFELMEYAKQGNKSANVVRKILEDKKQRLWIITNHGLIKISKDRQQFSQIKANNSDSKSLTTNTLQSSFLSPNNILWIGTFTGGLNLTNLEQEQFEHFKHISNDKNSLRADIVWGFSQDQDHNLWVATDGGGISMLSHIQQKFTHYLHDENNPHSISSNLVWSVQPQGADTVWAGTYDAGLSKLDRRTGKFTHFQHDPNDPNSLISNHVICIYIDNDNLIWLGTDKGLEQFNPKTQTFKHYRHHPGNSNSLAQNEVYRVIEDKQNRLWIATGGGGVSIFDKRNETFTQLSHQANNRNSIPHDVVAGINLDHKDNIWLTTYGSGIAQVNPQTLDSRTFNEQDGLVNNAALAITEGAKGEIWISTNNGLSKLNVRESTFTNFTIDDGLQDNEFSSGFLKTHDDKLLFGGLNGFNRFDPRQVKKKRTPLTVTLTQLRIDNRPVAINNDSNADAKADANTSSKANHQLAVNLPKPLYLFNADNDDVLTLNHHHNLVSFEFSTLTHQQHDNIEYQYQLTGFDKHWISTDHTLRLATYTNIPAGKYTLHLRARIGQNPWPTKHTVLSIIKKPAPWVSWWAITLYIISLVSIASLIIGQRIRRQKLSRQSQERLELALWGSHCDLWDWDLTKQNMFRSNRFRSAYVSEGYSHFSYATLQAFTHKDDVEHLIAQIDAHINNQSEYIDASYRRKDADGSWNWYRSRAKAVVRDNKGKALRIVGIVEDINELKLAQTELKEVNDQLETRVEARTKELSQALERLKTTQIQLVESEKMASLVELVVGISHELNTPLGIALTASSHVSDSLTELSNKTAGKSLTKKDLRQFQQKTTQGANLLINNLRRAIELLKAFKSLSPTTDKESITTFNLSSLLGKLQSVNNSRSDQHNSGHLAELNIQCQPNIDISTYKDDLVEILLQLLDNSYTHAFEQVDKPKVTITVVEQPDIIVIKYNDNGNGLTAHSRKKMFEPFYTSRRGSDCTGLGLAIIYNQVHYRLDGNITVADKTTEGFGLTIELPKYGVKTS